MKKNKMMRIASGLLVAVLLTTCAISGTFAKYVTEGKADDSARVAKWGVTVTAEGGMFAKTYIKHDDTVDEDTVGANTVISADDKNVVAPGTNGKIGGITLSGKPEVAVKVDVKATEVKVENWTIGEGENAEFYCPITLTFSNGKTEDAAKSETISGLDYTTAEAFVTAITEKIGGYSSYYKANTDLSTTNELHISWEWAFAGAEGSKQTDAKDTALGNVAAKAAEGAAPTISFNVTTTVTQVD